MELTETDVRVLRTLSGQEGGITGWGAAVGASIEFLRGAGYASKGTLKLKSPTQAAQPYRHRRRTMGDDNVIVLDVLTTINLPPERILNAALEADLAALVVVGYDKNGQYYFHSSIPHGSTVNWLLDQCKKRIIDEPSDMRGEPGTEEQTDDR
jgi:hypothetical protein